MKSLEFYDVAIREFGCVRLRSGFYIARLRNCDFFCEAYIWSNRTSIPTIELSKMRCLNLLAIIA